MEFTYDPAVFDQPQEENARAIILTEEAGLTTDDRWSLETDYLAPFLDALPGPALDIGCGAGRLSRELIRHGKSVVGIDPSPDMRRHARNYVEAAHGERAPFMAIDWAMAKNYEAGFFRSAVACWVLQHIPGQQLEEVIAEIARLLAPMSPFLLVNRTNRAIPVSYKNADGHTTHGWADDGRNLDRLLLGWFFLSDEEPMPTHLCEEGAYRRLYVRKP
jgi:SAM-dependent methyltransferase